MSLPINFNESTTSAIKTFVMEAQRFGTSFKIPRDLKICANNFELHQMADMMFQDEVYKLLYTTYVSSFNLPPILVPRTAGDYIKHGLKQKFPKLFSFLEVNYDEKPSVVKIFYPDEQVTSPLRRKNMYLSQLVFDTEKSQV